MSDRMPWSPREALAALALVLAAWVLALALLAGSSMLGWLFLGLAAWCTVGMVYTASRVDP